MEDGLPALRLRAVVFRMPLKPLIIVSSNSSTAKGVGAPTACYFQAATVAEAMSALRRPMM
jgi:hypothetical protein